MIGFYMGGKAGLRKKTDYETRFACAGGIGVFREEVCVDSQDEVMRYNLAFILPHLSTVDKGRILGFDNAHGTHERHELGEVLPVGFTGYLATAERFYREVEVLRRRYKAEKP